MENSKYYTGSEILLHWLSSYPDDTISESIINRASRNIAIQNDPEAKEINGSRWKYLQPLINFGHIELFNQNNPISYKVLPTTLLNVHVQKDKSILYLCGKRNKKVLDLWDNKFGRTYIKNNLTICRTERIDNFDLGIDVQKQSINPVDILRLLPTIDPEYNIGAQTDRPNFDNFEYFDPKSGWCRKSGLNYTYQVYRKSNLPPNSQPWFLVYRDKLDHVKYRKITTNEMASVALCFSYFQNTATRLSYSAKHKLLSFSLHRKIFLPLMILRPLMWLDCSSPAYKNNKYKTFENITSPIVKELQRIFNLKLEIN